MVCERPRPRYSEQIESGVLCSWAATTYLETTDDIEKFLSELRERLEKAIKTGQRIQIR